MEKIRIFEAWATIALRVIAFCVGVYLVFQGLTRVGSVSSLQDLFLNLNLLSRLVFGSIFMVLGVSPKNLLRSEILNLEELSPPEVEQFLKEHFASVPEKQVADRGHKEGVEWEVKYPERLPKPFNQGIARTCDFPVEFKVKNTANELLELNAYIESANESIAFVRTSPTRKWTWTPYPHHKSKLMGLDDRVKAQVLEEGQSVNFSLHAVYRPQFAISFYPGRLVLNYELAGHFSSGGKFESGPKRIEIPFAKEKILFVDDEPDILEQAKIFLEKENKHFNVKTAASAEKALKMLKIDKYDAIVSDYQMPEMDGIEFLRTLREQENDIPFIVLTGKGSEEVAMEALNFEADHYMIKSGDPRSQYSKLARMIVKEVELQREKKLQASEREYHRLFNSLNDAVLVYDLEGNLLAANKIAVKRLGYPERELLSMNLQEMVPPEHVEETEEKIRQTEKNETSIFETIHVAKGGEKIPVEMSSRLITYRGEPAILSVARNVTNRK